MLPKRIFVTGTDTEIGKTVVSAVLSKALAADYWKPVQCGDLEILESDTVSRLSGVSCFETEILLKQPTSPHLAAELEGRRLSLKDMVLPETSSTLVVEGAGGVLVPINEQEYLIDLAREYSMGVVLVFKNYLGSLNHTLLSIEALAQRGLKLVGMVCNGVEHKAYESFIEKKAGVPIILRLSETQEVTPKFVDSCLERIGEGFYANYRT